MVNGQNLGWNMSLVSGEKKHTFPAIISNLWYLYDLFDKKIWQQQCHEFILHISTIQYFTITDLNVIKYEFMFTKWWKLRPRGLQRSILFIFGKYNIVLNDNQVNKCFVILLAKSTTTLKINFWLFNIQLDQQEVRVVQRHSLHCINCFYQNDGNQHQLHTLLYWRIIH